jgi:DNA-binding CsgD family transcriptional regulator
LVAPDHDGDRDARLALDRLIARAGLSPKQAAVVAELRRGSDFAQIAARLGMKPTTARVHWYRARQKLIAAS